MCKDIENVDCGDWRVYYEQTQLRYNQFKESREDVNDDACPSTSTTVVNIEAVKEIILDSRRISIRKVADDVGMPSNFYK